MKQVKFDKLIRHAILACLLWGGASLPFAAWADPAGIGDCALTEIMTPNGPMTGWIGHPCVQPRPGLSSQDSVTQPGTTFVTTKNSLFAPHDPFADPEGATNFLMTIHENLYDFFGEEMPNTLPSTPGNPYNLHDGPVLTKEIDPTSPEDDLETVIDKIERLAIDGETIPNNLIEIGLAILEGDSIPGYPDRAYKGFPMLHYNGQNKVKKVVPICERSGGHHDDDDDHDHEKGKKKDHHDDEHGKGKKKGHHKNECKPGDTIIGGNVDVNMIYFNQRIESDTAFVDPSDVQDVPWTVTYYINVLNRGIEDFSPMVMHLDGTGAPHASMDQTFFPMLKEGTRYQIKVKQTKGKYFNLTYTWGWRIHPPRVQVMENANKRARDTFGNEMTLPEWEKDAFCMGGSADNHCDPFHNEKDRLYAISKIGDLSPAKRMWNIFRAMKFGGIDDQQAAVGLRTAFVDWVDRTKLPAGVAADPETDITLLYVNNTIYGSRQGAQGVGSGLGPASYKGVSNGSIQKWTLRNSEDPEGSVYTVRLLNGDYFTHNYTAVDFGGMRGWENQFQYTDPTIAFSHEGPHTGSTTIVGRQFTVVDDQIVLANEDRIFPINRGGIEEFLEASPRNQDDPINGEPQLGSGCFFTFGRNHAWPVAGHWLVDPISVPPAAADGTPSSHKVEITFNYEPSTRLRLYQFDPLHHDVAIYSLH